MASRRSTSLVMSYRRNNLLQSQDVAGFKRSSDLAHALGSLTNIQRHCTARPGYLIVCLSRTLWP